MRDYIPEIIRYADRHRFSREAAIEYYKRMKINDNGTNPGEEAYEKTMELITGQDCCEK